MSKAFDRVQKLNEALLAELIAQDVQQLTEKAFGTLLSTKCTGLITLYAAEECHPNEVIICRQGRHRIPRPAGAAGTAK